MLVVDDEPDFIELITYGLEVNGFECSSAGTGMEGLEQARRIQPDAVILDVMLPDLDGFTICEMLRSHPGTLYAAVVMLTCLAGTLTRMNGISSGADDYLVKPFNTPALVDRIRSAIRHRIELVSR